MPVKVLITGAAGYIGSALCPFLSDHGFEILALDRPQDAANPKDLKPLLAKADVLIPLAALVGAPACDADPDLARRINHEAVRLLNQLRSKSQAVLFPMTNNGYKPGEKETHVTEKTAFRADSLYTRTKFEAEQELMTAGNAVSFRLASVFGVSPSMRWDLLLHHFVDRASRERKLELFEANFKRNFVGLRDVLKCFLHTLRNFDRMKGEIFNLALEEANISKKTLAHKIAHYLPDLKIETHDQSKDPDGRDFFISSKKIKSTGFSFQHSLDEGIQEVLELSAARTAR